LDVLPEQLPIIPGTAALPTPVPCPGGCELRFCSEACATQNFAQQHRLLCPCIGRRGASTQGTSSSKRTRSDAPLKPTSVARTKAPAQLEQGLASMTIGTEEGDRHPPEAASTDDCDGIDISDAPPATEGASSAKGGASSSSSVEPQEDAEGDSLEGLSALEPLPRFIAHARASNEIFEMAAKAVAQVLCKLDGVPLESIQAVYAEAMIPFVGPPWWEAVATPDDVTDEIGFRRTLRQLVTESWTLLASVLGQYAPADCPLFQSPKAYATIVGAFERRNVAVQVASPVEEYFLAIDGMDEGEEKARVTALTAPVLDALDASYATAFDGIGLFPLQATMNHTCEPNVSLLKEEGEEERDGRVVARLSRDVAQGEELCNAYVDVSLPLRRRRRELREYGFECMCARCIREEAEKKKSSKREGKKRLK
jgi:hypothetical protein